MPANIIAPRSNTTQQMNTVRRTINFGTTGPQLIGSIPLNSFISKVELAVLPAFNGGTTNTLTVGTTYENQNELLAAGDSTLGTAGYYMNARGLGVALTQVSNGAKPAVQPIGDPEGGCAIWANFSTTGTAPTTGSVAILISFMPPTDS